MRIGTLVCVAEIPEGEGKRGRVESSYRVHS